MARYIDTADQAKMIRAALKRAFPAQKFSVRIDRFAGGSSVDIRWTDGPIAADVDAVVGKYSGGGFDGSIDMAYSTRAWLLPNGEVEFAGTRGTSGSGGRVDADETMKPHMDAELVQFSAKYVHTSRDVSPAFTEALKATYAAAAPEVRKEMLGDCWRLADRVNGWSFENATLETDFGRDADRVWWGIERRTSQAALAAYAIPSLEQLAA